MSSMLVSNVLASSIAILGVFFLMIAAAINLEAQRDISLRKRVAFFLVLTWLMEFLALAVVYFKDSINGIAG